MDAMELQPFGALFTFRRVIVHVLRLGHCLKLAASLNLVHSAGLVVSVGLSHDIGIGIGICCHLSVDHRNDLLRGETASQVLKSDRAHVCR